ncbi:MAG: A/G-specific adenine glycosylase [Paucimonas sp.]|nr:A/G-specific adenine glycosylase [Paucimonas sp.]
MKRVVDEAADLEAADPVFSHAVIIWQKKHGRHALPWQQTRDAYRIWLSEIMLQQTQVATVIPYYGRFLERFPNVFSLAAAPLEDVMALWSGLGYYTRARNLYRCAQAVVEKYGGIFPSDPALLADLPGIGRSTAAAIAAFAYGTRAAILDGNVKRVFARVFGIDGFPGSKPVEDRMWKLAVSLLPEEGIESYTQGLMDLGATICTRSSPTCARCPLAGQCIALSTGRVDELPVRKPRKAVPEKHTAMLVISDGNFVLLQQRPPLGIWGGLLSLPECESQERDTAQAAAASYGKVESCERLQAFTHAFTHFKLHVEPVMVTLSSRAPLAADSRLVWWNVNDTAEAALPAPVKKFLASVFERRLF